MCVEGVTVDICLFILSRSRLLLLSGCIQSRSDPRNSAGGHAGLQLLDIREHKADRKQFNVKDVFAGYLEAVQRITAAVDTMLDSAEPRSS